MGVYFCRLVILCVLRELIFAIRTDWFLLLGIDFCAFQKFPDKSLIIFPFFFLICAMEIHISNNTTECTPYVKPVIVLFLNERDKLYSNWTDTISLCCIFV